MPTARMAAMDLEIPTASQARRWWEFPPACNGGSSGAVAQMTRHVGAGSYTGPQTEERRFSGASRRMERVRAAYILRTSRASRRPRLLPQAQEPGLLRIK